MTTKNAPVATSSATLASLPTAPRKPARRRRNLTARPPAPAVVSAGLDGGYYRPLTLRQCDAIVHAAYEVLERTGVEIQASKCRDRLRKAGCRVDEDNNRVFFKRHFVESLVAFAPPTVILAGKDPKYDLTLNDRKVHLGTGGQAVSVLHLDGKWRDSTLADNYHIARLVDALEHIHFYHRPVVCRDIPNDLQNEELDINQFYSSMAGTNKHVMANSYRPESVPALREFGQMLAGGEDALQKRHLMSFVACWTVSPLRFAPETVEILDALIEHGFPVVLSSAPQAGATAPASLAGTMVQMVAEHLAGFAYVNLLRPGCPAIMGCVPAQADLRSGAFTGGSAEFALMNAASAQMAQFLKLPLYNSSGIADSKIPDAQSGIEKALTTVTAALAGSNYVHHSAGMLESLLSVAYEQYVIDNDINGQTMRLLKGFDEDDIVSSIDVIDEVCKGIGHYLGHDDTLARMETDYVYPLVFDRRSRADWLESGGIDLRERACLSAREILGTHYPTCIPPEVDKDIRKRFAIHLPEKTTYQW